MAILVSSNWRFSNKMRNEKKRFPNGINFSLNILGFAEVEDSLINIKAEKKSVLLQHEITYSIGLLE